MAHVTLVLTVLNWLVALAWLSRVAYWLIHVRSVPNLLRLEHARKAPKGRLTVVVPARNEARSIRKCIESLLQAVDVDLEIIAIDDRSTDSTGAILDNLAVEARAEGKRMEVVHVTVLPGGWTGKAHAMAVAAAQSSGDWLLFTDADVLFRDDALRRALTYAEEEKADHLVLLPTPICKTPGERMMLSFLCAMVIWGPRPWKVRDPRAKRDSVGIGAFNMVRKQAYQAIGGWEALRMEVLEDVRLGYVLKQAGFAARIATGRGLVRVRWANGAFGIVRNLTKNIFAAFRFRIALLLAAGGGLTLLCLLPFMAMLDGVPLEIPSLLMFLSLALLYLFTSRNADAGVGYVLLFPVAAALFLFSMLRSAVVTLTRRGVVWRGTFYPMEELRRHAGPLR
jgi:glycosyltransferase involved in cell wall biosynthesis